MLIACHATHGTCPFADSCSSSLNREDCLIDSFWFSISHFTSPCLDGLSGRELWPDPIAARKTSSASATSWQRTSWVLPQLVLPPIDTPYNPIILMFPIYFPSIFPQFPIAPRFSSRPLEPPAATAPRRGDGLRPRLPAAGLHDSVSLGLFNEKNGWKLGNHHQKMLKNLGKMLVSELVFLNPPVKLWF